MSNRGSRAYYLITDTLKDQLIADEFVNTVTLGDITEVDLNKQTIFPLSHIIINNATYQGNVWLMNVTVLAMDVVDQSKLETTDVFLENNNEQDILNTQLAVINKLLGVISRGSLYSDNYQLQGDASCEPFVDRFENMVTGWAATFDVVVKNDIDIC
tara:strand:+ start:1519 stop:1989 length:471 start_codon:yes stop_codon:yes gene_type:complete